MVECLFRSYDSSTTSEYFFFFFFNIRRHATLHRLLLTHLDPQLQSPFFDCIHPIKAFLMELDDAEEHELPKYLLQVPEAVRRSLSFKCPECQHTAETPWPPIVDARALSLSNSGSTILLSSDDDSTSTLSSSTSSLSSLSSSTSSLSVSRLSDGSSSDEIELVCFHSKRSYLEDCLGFPLTIVQRKSYVRAQACNATHPTRSPFVVL